MTSPTTAAAPSGTSVRSCSVSLRYENLRLRSALRDMLREAESDLRNNDGNPYRAVVLRAKAALNISTPNAAVEARRKAVASDGLLAVPNGGDK